jgi:Fe-S cluster assembly iron-binding protein IscA
VFRNDPRTAELGFCVVPLRTLAYADLSPEAAREVGKRLVELAAQAEEGQVVRVHIAVGGAVGFQGRMVVSELREDGEEQ